MQQVPPHILTIIEEETAKLKKQAGDRRLGLLIVKAMREQPERVACCIYESLFDLSWSTVTGSERECYLDAARAVLKMLAEEEKALEAE